jgi:hypothetical protein
MKTLLENWNRFLTEGMQDTSDTLFFLKSPWGMKRGKFDHVGFVLKDGRMKDMSGHRGEMIAPIISTWEQLLTDDVFWEGWPDNEDKPQSPDEAKKIGIYQIMKLPKVVDVPDEIVCRTSDKSKVSENCGSFVFNVLHNAGINPDFLKDDKYIVVGKQF